MQGIEHEIAFWKDFIKTERFLKGWLSDEKTPELNDIVYNFLKERPDAEVLDCGSGVVSILKGTAKNLTACDPLANEYCKIFDYFGHGILPPNTQACEDLTFVNLFDIVHISNALDHCQNPVLAYKKMYKAVKPGGFLIVQGFVNEGTHEKWQGMHQHNLDVEREKYLVVTDKTGLTTTLGTNPYYSIKIPVPHLEKDWLIWIAQKPNE